MPWRKALPDRELELRRLASIGCSAQCALVSVKHFRAILLGHTLQEPAIPRVLRLSFDLDSVYFEGGTHGPLCSFARHHLMKLGPLLCVGVEVSSRVIVATLAREQHFFSTERFRRDVLNRQDLGRNRFKREDVEAAGAKIVGIFSGQPTSETIPSQQLSKQRRSLAEPAFSLVHESSVPAHAVRRLVFAHHASERRSWGVPPLPPAKHSAGREKASAATQSVCAGRTLHSGTGLPGIRGAILVCDLCQRCWLHFDSEHGPWGWTLSAPTRQKHVADKGTHQEFALS